MTCSTCLDLPSHGRSREAAPLAVARRTPLVLLAEDCPDMREMIAEALVEAGYDLVQVEDGVALLEALGQTPPDLVITDVRMPGLSGLDAVEQLREVDTLTPVIVVTGFGHRGTHAHARALGVTALIDKPFAIPDLLARVRQALPPGRP